MKHKIRDYGYVSPTLEAQNYFSGSLPKIIVNPTRDWRPSTPSFESQASGYETNDCTIYGSENQIQIYIKGVFGKDVNYSERFISNGLFRDNRIGEDPHKPLEFVRKNGNLDQDLLPMAPTLAEYQTPRPLPQNLLDKAKKWGYDLTHEYVFANNPSKEARIAMFKENLKYSPLGVSVTAWREEGGYYVDDGRPNTHWCVLVHMDDDGTMYVYDSYDLIVNGVSTALIKKLHPDHHIEVCKRIYLVPASPVENISFIQRMIDWLKEQIGLLPKQIGDMTTPPDIEEPKPEAPVVKKGRLDDLALAIRDYEGKPGDLNYKNNNPGNIKGLDGKFLKFKTMEEGFAYLKEYIKRASTGKHRAYKDGCNFYEFFKVYAPSSDNNNPKKYAEYVCKRLGVEPTVRVKDIL